MTANKLTANSTSKVTLVEGNSGTDDSLDTNNFTLAPVSGTVPITLTLANAPAAGGIVINNSGTITATSARAIDVGTGATANVTATGAKITLNNSGTIQSTGTGKGDLFRSNFDIPQGVIIVNNTGTMKSTINSNDSQGIRLGKVYTASQITITNGSATATAAQNANAIIQTNDADAIRAGGVNPTASNTAYGSSVIVNYGKIIAQNYDGGTLNANNAIDIGQGQSANVNNFGTIIGDESGLGADVGYNGPPNYGAANAALTFAANYIVTNEVGGTITGNNGAGIASGTATVTNSGTITGKATGVASANPLSTGSNPTVIVTNANGTGILTSGAATVTNNASGIIQGSASSGTAVASNAININSGTITNRGTIQETGTGSKAGAAVLISGSTGSTLTNYGTISGATGTAITMGSGADTINLYTGGTITGTIDGGAGTDTLNLNMATGGAASGTLSGVTNVETLNVNGGAWTISDAQAYASGITITSGANLIVGPNGSTAGAIVDNGTLTYSKTGSFTKSELISGTGKVVQAGSGTLVLSNADNSYSGGTSLNSGMLDIATVGAAGTGAITFAAGAQTLDIEQAALASDGSFGDTLAGFGLGDTIDLRGIGAATATSFDTNTNKLTVAGGSQTVTLQLDGAPPAGYGFGVASNSNGGTFVTLDQKATIQSIATSPASGYVKAGGTVTITLTTSKAVAISGANPVLNLLGGGTATFTGIDSSGTKLTFTETVANGQDASGVQIVSVTNAGSILDTYRVSADLSGAINQTPTGPVIDTTAPTVMITSGGGVTNQSAHTISGTVGVADNNSTVTIYETYNGATNAIGTATVTNGQFSASVNLSSGNGSHVIYASDTDPAGNTGTSPSITYDLETTAPPVTITSAGGLTNQTTQTITGTVDVGADPAAANSTITVTDTTTGTVLNTGSVDANGNFSISVTLSGEGTHALQVTDVDQAQNSGSASISYNLDTTPPGAPSVALTRDTGASSSDRITNDPSITFTTSASGDTLLYAVDGSAYTTTAPTFATDGSADGAHTVSVKEQDPAGNMGPAASLTFTLDTTAPTTSPSISLVNDTGSSNSDSITSDPSFTAAAGTSGDTLVYAVDGATTYSATAPVFTRDGTQDGTHTISVKELDAAGNAGPASTLTFTLDTTAPAAPSLSLTQDTGPSATDKITSNPSITYAASASGDTLLYKADGATTYTTTAPVFKTDGTQDGSHTVSIVEKDAAGNTSAASTLTFKLDTTAPDIDFTSIGGNVNSTNQIVNGFAGVENAGTTVSIFQDGNSTPSATATVRADGYFSAAVALNGNGTHALTASDADAAGNVGATDEQLTFNVDTSAPTFTAGNLVISISGNGDGSGNYGDNQATPLVLQQITTDGTFVSQIVLPQTTTTVNGVTESVISAEYGSSSEGLLQLSVDGHSLVIAGYGINAQTYNQGGVAVYGNAALAQTTSLQGGQYTAVPRVIAEINANGSIDTSTSLYNIYDKNNPRSVATIDGTKFYISGQGVKGDTTQGLYYVQDGATTATRIDGSTDTRVVEIVNGQLYVSRDSKQGSGGTSNISVYGSTLPTSARSGTILPGISQAVTLNGSNGNTVNGSSGTVNLDPEQFFFANATTLYVADGGIPKQGGIGDGGLQKWTFNGSQWTLQYTLSQGLNIISGSDDEGTTGLIGLTGRVNADGTVDLYATNQTIGDTDQKYVFSITDQISATTVAPGQSFQTIVTAAAGTNIRGISFAPTPLTPTEALLHDTGSSATDGITNDPTITYAAARSSDTLLYSVDGGTFTTSAPTFARDGSQDGTHTVSVEEKDKNGAVGPASSITFNLDTLAPSTPNAPALASGSDTGASSSDGVTNITTPTFAGTAESGSTVTLYDGTNVVGTATADTSGAFSITSSALTDGSHSLRVTSTDAAGNVSAASSVLTVVIDTTAPGTPAAPTLTAASDTGSSPTDGITSNATPTLVGTAEAGSTVTVYDGTTVVGTGVATSGGAYQIATSTLSDGAHTLSVTATDKAGNVSSASSALTVVIDTTAPSTPAAPTLTAASDTGSSSTDGITKNPTPTVTGTAEAGATVTLYDGSTIVGTAVTSSTGAYAITSSSLADGSHALTVAATDTAGNVSAASSALTVVIDTTAPSTPATPTLTAASDTGVSSTDGITKIARPTVTGTADAGSTVTLYDGTTIVGSGVVNSAGNYQVITSTLSQGAHSLTAIATDKAGNVSAASSALTVVIDTTAPAVPAAPTLTAASDTGSSSTDGITKIATPTLTGTAEAGSTVTLYDGTTAVGTAIAASNGTYSITPSASLSEGAHALRVRSTDVAGNASSLSVAKSITIDTQAPGTPTAPTLTAASDTGSSSTDGITKVIAPTITGTAEAGATVTLLDGTTVLGTAVAASNGSYQIKSSTLAEGAHSLTVTATDKAGNVSAASSARTVVIDTIAPAVPAAPTLMAASDSGSSSTDGITRITTPRVTGTAEAGSTVTLYAGTNIVGSGVANSAGTYQITTSTLSQGAYTLKVTATDKAGNVSATSSGLSIIIDTTVPATPPAPMLTAESDTGSSSTDGITKVATPTITGTAEAGSTVSLYDGATSAANIVGTSIVKADGTYTITSSALADGAHSLRVRASDVAGNISALSSARTVVIDTKSPAAPATPTLTAASDTGVSSTDGITKNTTPTIVGTTEAGATVTLYDGATGGSGTILGTTVADSKGAYAITSSTLADGSHILSVRATDVAGNTSAVSPSRSIVIDTQAPTVQITSAGGSTTKATQTVSGTGEAGTTVTITDNGSAVLGTVVVKSDGTWSRSVNLGSQGTHSLVATDADRAGNIGSSQPVVFNYGSGSQTMTISSLSRLVQAMGAIDGGSSSTSQTATPPITQEHQLASSHG